MGQGLSSSDPWEINNERQECWKELRKAEDDGSPERVRDVIFNNCNRLEDEYSKYNSVKWRQH